MKIKKDKLGYIEKEAETKEEFNQLVHEKVDEKNRKARLSKFVLDDSKSPQVIDHAVGMIKIGKKRFRYYGARINENVQKKVKDKLVTITEKSDVLILENGDVISKNSKPNGVDFEFDSIMTLKSNRWSLDSIRSFCNNNFKREDYTFKKVYEEFRKFYEDNMVFEDELWYSLLALRDLKSYFWDLIDKFLIIKHGGITGSAKSKAMKIGANSSFNGKKFLCPTPANFFRYRHHNKAVIFIEEAERLFDNSKKTNNADSELVEYLNGSYEKGNSVPRQNDKNINQTDEFDPAGELAIGSISALKGALEKRSVPLYMVKAQKNDARGKSEVPTENDLQFSIARDKAYICGLLNYRLYRDSISEVTKDYGLANRELVLAKPYIALAKCIDKTLEKDIGNFLSKLFEIRDEDTHEGSWENLLAKCLVEIYCIDEGEKYTSIDMIKDKFVFELGRESTTPYKIHNTKIGILMSKLGLIKFKHSTGIERGYRMDFFDLIKILLRQEYMKLENIMNIVSKVSMCKYNEDRMNKWYTDTYLTPYTLGVKNEI